MNVLLDVNSVVLLRSGGGGVAKLSHSKNGHDGNSGRSHSRHDSRQLSCSISPFSTVCCLSCPVAHAVSHIVKLRFLDLFVWAYLLASIILWKISLSATPSPSQQS